MVIYIPDVSSKSHFHQKEQLSLLGLYVFSNCGTLTKHGILTPVPETTHSPGPNTVNAFIEFSSKNANCLSNSI